MGKKSTFLLIAVLVGASLLFFQNCQPMDGMGTTTMSSGGSGNNNGGGGGNSNTPPPPGPPSASGKTGQVISVNSAGQVYGWARDPASPGTKLTVFFYRDNPANAGGTLLGSIVADDPGLGGNNGYFFSFNIPQAMIDNRTHNLYVYMDSATQANAISGAHPMAYGAYRMTQAGINHYNANLANRINTNCTICHAFSIESGFYNMLSPTPFDGGTVNNNNFIQNANGQAHPINGCNQVAGLCDAIRQWWTIEFGN